MNKKIKVIELFNMIANGNIPEMIEYDCQRYQWFLGEYRRLEDDRRLTDLWIIEQILNDEVEILEDEEEIEKIKVDDNNYIVTDNGTNLKGRAIDITFVNKINEIIDKVNELDKKINKED